MISGKTLSMLQYVKQNKDKVIYSNYPNLGNPIDFDGILETVKQPLRMDQRIENLIRGKSDGFYQIRR
jgi:hypothetical protein